MKLLRATIIVQIVVLIVSEGAAAFQTKQSRALEKSQVTQHAVFDANRISVIMMNDGQFVSHVITGNSGMEWPKGSFKLIDFASGIWVVGKARSDGSIRTAAAEYQSEFQPGNILPDGTPDDPTLYKHRWYKITPHDLLNPGLDYLQWPTTDGAPIDANGNPLVFGDQTFWCVFNDADTALHNRVFGSAAIGIEVQMTVWGYNRANILGDIMFVRAVIIHRGTETLDSTFFALWDDADLGDAGDDYKGCDTAIRLGYFYNSDDGDATYNTAPPAVGRVFLQTPVVQSPGDTAITFAGSLPNYRNVSFYAFPALFKSGGWPLGEPYDAAEVFNSCSGLALDGTPFIDPISNQQTRFYFSGDPVTNVGWTERNPVLNQPGDRRMLMSCGPFTFSPGDTQEVVFAVIIARGTTNLNSVTRLKGFSSVIRQAYDAGYFFPIPTSPPIEKKPAQFGLRQNYPNPFNLSTRIPFSVKREGRIMLEICDLIGRRVRVLKNELMQPGEYETEWNGLNDAGNAVNSGPYFVRIATNGGVSTIKIIAVK